MPDLKIQSGSKAGERFVFTKSIVVGRDPMADLTLADPTVSRRHAMLNWLHHQCVVLDLESENGTFVNDSRVTEPVRLRSGDFVRWGTVVAEYSEDREGTDDSQERASVTSSTSLRLIDTSEQDPRVLVSMTVEQAELERLDSKPNIETRVSDSRRLAFFQELGSVATQTFDSATVLDFVLERLFALLPQTERAFIMKWSEADQGLELACARTRDGNDEQPPASHTLLRDVIEKKEGVLIADVASHPTYGKASSMMATHLRTAICVPMRFKDETFGVIQVDSTKSGAPFSKNDLSLLLAAASQVSLTLAYSKLHGRLVEREILEHDILLARRIQQHFLPAESFSVSGCTFAFEYSPALAVGGDFYDFLDLGRGRVGVAVGDVSGKGVSAALYMAKVASEMRYRSVGLFEPAEILTRLNDALARNTPEGMFITLVLLSFDPATGELLIANAGHLLPLVREASGKIVTLGKPGGLPLGVSEGVTFEQYEYEIEDSDRVVVFTDGITEAMSPRGEMFGDERLFEQLKHSDGSVAGTTHSVVSTLKKFVGDAAQYDDVTFVCFGKGE